MPANAREAILEGVQAATRVHRELDLPVQGNKVGGGIRVFETIDQKGHGLMFRPLDGLLGLCVDRPDTGVLISTKRPLSVQRFTAAHELGHLEMGHDFSLDNEEMISNPRGSSQVALQEISANAFGAEFLMPRWLIQEKMEWHGWGADDLNSPLIVYQLSLRLGVSFEALCWQLSKRNWISQTVRQTLLNTQPKAIKAHLLNGNSLDDSWADVWMLTDADHGEYIEASPNDVFVLELQEHGNGGYFWDVDRLSEHGFDVLTHDPHMNDEVIGSPQYRSWSFKSDEPLSGEISLKEYRPWDEGDIINHFGFTFSLWGKEYGFPRFIRPLLQAA